ncbi:unnamed protein product [Owenia fusiformis]|uniref:Pectate lyase domain-containing protein n=1 Tax=Owenia fusiformis TaxID=6347 RepID=A0A8S4NNH0_OWEFU|nr:unnamed protein product [Owenia fusiformis]
MLFGILVLCYFGNVIGQAPDWFSECVGFGCTATEYRHERCESEPNYQGLLFCLNLADFVHVTFTGSGTITIPVSIRPTQGLILDGSGHDITLTGESIELNSSSIVYRINFDTGADDALKLQRGYENAWIHRCSFRNYGDGLIDITQAYSHVTVSNCRFAEHDKTMLIGSSTSDILDERMRITIHNNYFVDCRQRMPRVRYATVHIYNNVFQDWGLYAVLSSQTALVLLENNYFDIVDITRAEMAHDTRPRGSDTSSGYLRAEANFYNTGIRGRTNQAERVGDMPYQYQLATANDDMRAAVIAGAGALVIKKITNQARSYEVVRDVDFPAVNDLFLPVKDV